VFIPVQSPLKTIALCDLIQQSKRLFFSPRCGQFFIIEYGIKKQPFCQDKKAASNFYRAYGV